MKKWFLFFWLALFSLISHATPLPANDVFKFNVKVHDPNSILLDWQIKKGYFLYSDRIVVNSPNNNLVHIGTIRFPETLKKTDSQGRTYTVYRDQLMLMVPLLAEQAGETLIEVHYQGCADDGFCYPPETRQLKLTVNKELGLESVNIEIPDKQPAKQATKPTPKPDSLESIFHDKNWIMVLLTFYGLGLLLSFTPCVLPMVPVLSGIIVGHGHTISTRKAFFLSLSYVLSMAFTYAIVGAVVAELGSNLQIMLQAPWAVALFSLIFVLLALSMFGFFELRLPAGLQSKLSGLSRSQNSGHYLSAAIMGALSTLILSPCVTAPLIGALSYIAHTGNILFGSLALFLLGLGMGTPLLLIGTSAGKWLPKAGNWMNGVKSFFGILLLGVAIYLLSRLLPPVISMILWAALLVFTGIYSGALTAARSNQEKFGQGLGILLLTYGLLILIGASMGNTNPLQPIALTSSANGINENIKTKLTSLAQIDQAIQANQGKFIMLDFYADWCASCKVMEQTTLADYKVREALKNFAVLTIDITKDDAETKAIMQRYNVIAPPVFMFLDKQGQVIEGLTLVGEVDAGKFLEQLIRVQDTVP